MAAPRVLSALDVARIQLYHFKAIIIAGMSLFTDAYDLFCIAPVLKMLGEIYYHEDSIGTPILSIFYAIALLGAALGQLIVGYLGDRLGRRRVYGLCLLIMVLSSFGCGFSVCTSRRSCVMASLGFFRFILGLGIGGDYPLSATIMSEFANKKTRGTFISAVFSMQGLGILMSSTVTMAVCSAFKTAGEGSSEKTRAAEADIAWRLILMIGSIPAALTFYWRMRMPETARYTALVENDAIKAEKDMQKVMSISKPSEIEEDLPHQPPPPPSSTSSCSYKLFSRRFFSLHGRDLFAASANWFLVDVVFYTSNLLLSQILNLSNKPTSSTNVYDTAFEVAKVAAIVAVCSTIPGYWFTVYFIDRVGRVKIQIMGFFCMAVVYLVAGIPYSWSTCHGISGAVGKLGAIVGTVGFLWGTKRDEEHKDAFPDVKRVRIAFLILGGVCIAGVLVTYFFTRETMGRSLEENEEDDICTSSAPGSPSASEFPSVTTQSIDIELVQVPPHRLSRPYEDQRHGSDLNHSGARGREFSGRRESSC
ncbi:hypothetical protein Bca101_057191 [Brassica carinata]